ncbi:hypothetical protein X777_15498 [Ooceraea biroi]|uniref:Uncharacterized protein n=1 Tax=Ooceraea biroi TaxID=2015173 RepID=A0A026VUZ8_OOCBI|nr:hypothetical protein X777_15498 [Ooceraea biroi]
MPKVFSNEEYTDIHFVYGFCDGNARAAVREYQCRFPNRRVPDRFNERIANSVTEMQQHFQECRTVTNSVLRRCLACIDVQGQHFEMRH